MKQFCKLLPIGMLLASATARGDIHSELADHLSSKLTQAAQWASLVTSSSDDGDVDFKQFFLGFDPEVSFGINSVLDLKVAPEVTFIWEETELPARF